MTDLARRSFLTGMAAAIAAPYVITKSGILMPVKAIIKRTILTTITEVSNDGENWVALAYLNAKAGLPIHRLDAAKSFPYRRVVFVTGWTPIWKKAVA